MIGKLLGIMMSFSVLYGVICGNAEVVGRAATAGAAEAVSLAIALLGNMCLWSGTARVLDRCGFTKKLEKIISPLLRVIYPDSYFKGNGIRECAANVSANFLGIGNAALPLGIETMKKFADNSGFEKEKASDDMVMFAVLATTPFQLIPATLAAMREAAGSVAPYEVLLPIWICEIATTVFAVIVCKCFAKIFK